MDTIGLHDLRTRQAADMSDDTLGAYLYALLSDAGDELAPLVAEAARRLRGRTRIVATRPSRPTSGDLLEHCLTNALARLPER